MSVEYTAWFIILTFISIFCGICACLIRFHDCNENLDNPFSDLIEYIISLMFGERFYVKVNGVWSIHRGKRLKKGGKLKIKYGRSKHLWILDRDYWDYIDRSDDCRQEVIKRNVEELKKKYPKKKKVKLPERLRFLADDLRNEFDVEII